MKFTFLEHTADTQVECHANNLPELLEIAAHAMYAIALHHIKPNRNDRQHRIEIQGFDREELLVRWLQELLFLLDTQHFVPNQIQWICPPSYNVNTETPYWITTAQLGGYTCESEDRAEEIKAITYHDLAITEMTGPDNAASELRVRIIFDI